MTDIAALRIPITIPSAQVESALKKIQAELDKSEKRTQQYTQSTDKAAKASERNANAMLSLAQAAARGAAAAGDFTRAEQILTRALDGSTASALRQQGASNQLAAVQRRASGETKSLSEILKGSISNVDNFVGSITQIGSAFAIIGAAQAAVDFAATSASIQAAEASFDSLAESAGQSGDALLAALQKASGGAVAQADVIKSANTALLLLGNDAASKLPRLLEIARASATTLGTDVGQVFDSLVTGISRNSIELIDNAGITIKSGEAYAVYADEIGKSVDALTSAERQQAILNAVLAGGEDILQRTAGAGETNALAFQQAAAASEDLKNKLGGLLADGLAPAARGFADFANDITDAIDQINQIDANRLNVSGRILDGATNYEEYANRVTAAQQRAQAAFDAAYANDPASKLVAQSAGLDDAAIYVERLTQEQFALALSLQQLGVSALDAQSSVSGLSIAQIDYANSLINNGAATDEAIAKATAFASSLSVTGDALTKVLSEVALSAPATAQLASDLAVLSTSSDANRTAVSALAQEYLNGGSNAQQFYERVAALFDALNYTTDRTVEAGSAIQRTSVEAAGFGSTLAALGGDLDNTGVLSARLTGLLGGLADGLIGVRGETDEVSASLDISSLAAQAQEQALSDATLAAFEAANGGATLEEQAYAAAQALLENGDAGAQAAALLANSSNDVDILTAALYEQEAAAIAAANGMGLLASISGKGKIKGAGSSITRYMIDNDLGKYAPGFGSSGGGSRARGGGGKSEAQKLAEKEAEARKKAAEERIKDEQELTEKLVEIEEDRQAQILEIIKDANEAREEAQRDFHQYSLDDRASFYASLAGLDQAQAQELSAAYEAIVQETAKIAQEQGADVAEAYQKASLEILQARQERAQKIKELEEKGLHDQAQYLRDVEELARIAEENRLNEIKAGRDSINNNEAEAIADANADAADKQQELLGGAERLGEADRERLAILAQQTAEYQRQLALYQQLGGVPGAPMTPTGTTPTAPPLPPAGSAPTYSAAGTSNEPTVVATPELEAVINEVIGRNLRELIDAVRSGNQAIVQAEQQGAAGIRQVLGALKPGAVGRGA